MATGGTRPAIGRFTGTASREAFLAAYDGAMALWPDRESFDVETRFGTTRAYRHGDGPGVPIVLVHGHGGNASNWYGLAPRLGERHTVYALDNIDDPGGSVQTSPLRGPGDAAVWLDETLAGLGLDRVHLVGHSYGGWLALGAAVHRADRLAALTLLDPGGLEKVPAKFLLGLVAAVFAMRAPASWKPRLARLLAEAALVERAEIMAPVMLGARAFRPNRRPAGPYTDDELRRVTVPAQIVLGGRSMMLRPARALARARALIGSLDRAEIVPGAGHGVPQEVPDLVAARVSAFTPGEARR